MVQGKGRAAALCLWVTRPCHDAAPSCGGDAPPSVDPPPPNARDPVRMDPLKGRSRRSDLPSGFRLAGELRPRSFCSRGEGRPYGGDLVSGGIWGLFRAGAAARRP